VSEAVYETEDEGRKTKDDSSAVFGLPSSVEPGLDFRFVVLTRQRIREGGLEVIGQACVSEAVRETEDEGRRTEDDRG
jgi:hypothetical protein